MCTKLQPSKHTGANTLWMVAIFWRTTWRTQSPAVVCGDAWHRVPVRARQTPRRIINSVASTPRQVRDTQRGNEKPDLKECWDNCFTCTTAFDAGTKTTSANKSKPRIRHALFHHHYEFFRAFLSLIHTIWSLNVAWYAMICQKKRERKQRRRRHKQRNIQYHELKVRLPTFFFIVY